MTDRISEIETRLKIYLGLKEKLLEDLDYLERIERPDPKVLDLIKDIKVNL